MGDFEPKQFGKYFLIDKLAVGGMAEIYKAKTYGVDGFEKVLCIKKILAHAAADRDFITMLTDEAKLTVYLSHANIVQVYDLGKVGDDYFIAMEFINGINLRDIMYTCREIQTRVPPEIAVYIISEICKGLDYAHRKTNERNEPLNIVHRDISPQNILISYEGEVKIVDFGIAKAAMNISHTMAGILKGKIAYMSPEQAMGQVVDNRTDIFSTGILLYETLTGTKLFTGDSQFEVLKKIRMSDIKAETLPDSIPELLKPILAKALASDINERYQTAGDFQIDLTKYLYTSHSDFSPRKLAAFIKKIFSDTLSETKEKSAREEAYESQTSSMNVEEGAKQVDIVHREATNAKGDETSVLPGPKEGLLETAVTPIPSQISKPSRPPVIPPREAEPYAKKENRLKRSAVLILTIIAILTSLWMAQKFVPALRFWEAKEEKVVEEKTLVTTATIQSEPAGANVSVDGKPTGLKTPAVVPSLEVGKSYRINLELENHIPAEQILTISSAQPVTITIPLAQESGIINLASTPAGASVFINGNDTGKVTPTAIEKMPLNVDQKITLKKEGFEDAEQTVKLTNSAPQNMAMELKELAPDTGVVNITSTPAGAKIEVDGKDTGQITPSKIVNLSLAEEHKIKLMMDEYEPFEQTVNLKDKTPFDLGAELKKTAPPESEKPVVTGKGSVQVSSEPSGAVILLNGQSTGKSTPATLSDLELGKTYSITLKKDMFYDVKKSVKVTEAKKYYIKGNLNSIEPAKPAEETEPSKPTEETKPETKPSTQKGSISISSNPSGAEVYVNSEYKGTSPITVSVEPGSASVMVKKSGFSPYNTRVNVKPGKTVNLSSINLKGAGTATELYGEVSLNSTPPRATVTFDGQVIPAKTPVTVRRVRTDQPHTVTISLDGYRSWTKSFSMDSTNKSFHINLEPK